MMKIREALISGSDGMVKSAKKEQQKKNDAADS